MAYPLLKEESRRFYEMDLGDRYHLQGGWIGIGRPVKRWLVDDTKLRVGRSKRWNDNHSRGFPLGKSKEYEGIERCELVWDTVLVVENECYQLLTC
jgi:hypothetical protein